MFVGREDMQELTGYVRRAEQVRWLRANGIAFRVNRRGSPMVLQSELEQAMSSSAGSGVEDLNWDVMAKL